MEDQLRQIQKDYLDKINSATSLKKLDELFLTLFGKNGEITILPKEFPKLSLEEKKRVGPLFNQIKQELEKAINDKRNAIREESYKALENEESTMQPRGLQAKVEIKERTGHLHPITKFENEIVETFKKLGFQQYDAPQIDDEYNNFEALNIPENHPARDLWDTFYLNLNDQKGRKLLLRTHTSNAQNRIMKSVKTPIRMLMLGRCFRYENIDARHEHTFPQFELVYIDKNVSMENLQYMAEFFLQEVFGKDIKARLRPKYYPFVEPGTGIDALCMFCKGTGCKTCSGLGWLEVAGAGMIHPKVLQNGGIDPNEFSGIAWGFGTLRLAMLKFGVDDIRKFHSGDLKFLQKF